MRPAFRILLLVFFFVSCARFQPSEPVKEADLGIPTELTEKFSVKEAEAPAVKPEEKPEEKPRKKPAAPPARKVSKDVVTFPDRWKGRPPMFRPGDRSVYDITFFGATAGELDLRVLPNKIVADRNVFHVRAEAKSTSVFALFYRVNDYGESFIDAEAIVPLKFQLRQDESIQQRDIVELYDHKKRKMYYWSKWEHKKKGNRLDKFEIDIPNFTQDSVSAFYFIRTLPLEEGKSYQFDVSTNGKMRTVRATVVRRERLQTRAGEFPTIVVKPEVVLDGILQKAGDTFLWVTDDEYRDVVKLDAKIKIGSVIAYLRELYREGKPVGEAGHGR
ncbi:MAG: DUF3108 domain-containing protein [Bdellovibrionales bacterium]|nr:DUF3108 domain-containing protein [Bdellovibrionales bacterium]